MGADRRGRGIGAALGERPRWSPRADDVPTAPMGYSMVQEGLCVGRSWGPPVAPSLYHGEAEFTGVIRVVEMRTDASRQLRTG